MPEKQLNLLLQHLPEASVPVIWEWVQKHRVAFKITRVRSTKLGDYRHPFNANGHRISVNHNLNKYAFLVTTVHEFAHLATWIKYRNKRKPHGSEWKTAFSELMEGFLSESIFPHELTVQLRTYLRNPAASSCTDLTLMRLLSNYDTQRPPGLFALETLDHGTVFCLPNGRSFLKGERLRKRYKCIEQLTHKAFLFNPLAQVQLQQTAVDELYLV